MRFVNTMELLLASLVGAALVTADASAQTLYKLIDKNGKVTYVETPPKDYDGKVIRLDIDPNANIATSPKKGDVAAERSALETKAKAKAEAAAAAEATLQDARDRLEELRQAYADARDNPREGEVRRVGNVGGGTRPVFSEAYQRRLDTLEKEVRDAEEQVRRLERGG